MNKTTTIPDKVSDLRVYCFVGMIKLTKGDMVRSAVLSDK